MAWKWLTYSDERNALFCFLCLAFSKPNDPSSFIGGMTDWRHVHQRIEEHERGMAHRQCAEAYVLNCSRASVDHLLEGRQLKGHREQVKKRRQVLERVVEVVRVLGKRGLSYRQEHNEAAYTLDINSLDHGNFLELIILLGKYDVCLKEHLSSVIEKSKQIHASGTQGRGSLITLLSKTTVDAVIDAIKHLIQESISADIKKAGMYSVQLDTTQDVTGREQCSVILRFVTDAVHERLVAVVQCSTTTGQSFVTLLTEVLESLQLDIGLCIGNATDGASNMQGQYRGFSALMASKNPTHQHVWCYAHVLNLVLSDTTHSVIESGSLFDLLNDIAVFIRDSYTRVSVWETESQDKRHKRISTIGETRWWAKHHALRKVFGNFGRPDGGLFVEVVSTLSAIMKLKSLASNARNKARGYRDGLLRYETVLTAQLFLRVFEFTSPLSKYLQTGGMDILSAHRMVTTTHDSLTKIARDFPAVKDAADCFVHWANEKLEEQDDLDLEVEAALPQKRLKKKKVLPGEMAQDESLSDSEKAYEVNVHHQILDTAVEAMHHRFLTHGTLYADLSLLHPKNFPLIQTSGGALPVSALQELSKCLVVYDSRATVTDLQIELRNLAQQWDRLVQSQLDNYATNFIALLHICSCGLLEGHSTFSQPAALSPRGVPGMCISLVWTSQAFFKFVIFGVKDCLPLMWSSRVFFLFH
ncbi:uncharacterized protein LOC124489198 isoform X2 [Hypomesus transpacificus]|uniref:uncharacterized protein LOC124462749 isoform X2 n=1 Tax=Hypomesus transpacificus TaxID=137520 RepID=UPI001F083B1D|nr:uncharacterized protein LOC124462749 isoform X2 [Hypomesus transpacificus]XP_046870363.1 uncharacterized protein LOC124462775 isoform X2 [Hypomesus transpacificus]XP_046870365.1 uncharacterized protein LOC124462776 isoform X2 [Hypomesus transpacificus]XP_046872497.1 uncharacterized protein LOC124464725 isoform X2 [Hypomesus transpacificus]XP_046872991.1 uncharacterized protein LOC124465314 isoform X2 [Hypomesus transpacificus]XP_046873242.1 uncharacterized protein LOC124465481 isoform X2 [H